MAAVLLGKLLEGAPGAVGMPRDGVFLGALFESLAPLTVGAYLRDWL